MCMCACAYCMLLYIVQLIDCGVCRPIDTIALCEWLGFVVGQSQRHTNVTEKWELLLLNGDGDDEDDGALTRTNIQMMSHLVFLSLSLSDAVDRAAIVRPVRSSLGVNINRFRTVFLIFLPLMKVRSCNLMRLIGSNNSIYMHYMNFLARRYLEFAGLFFLIHCSELIQIRSNPFQYDLYRFRLQ